MELRQLKYFIAVADDAGASNAPCPRTSHSVQIDSGDDIGVNQDKFACAAAEKSLQGRRI